MIRYTTGDILRDDAEALVNTVNCVGVMGRGIALQFKNAFPNNYKAYKKACDAGEVEPGSMFVFETEDFTHPRFVINFPTKRHWRGKSRMEDVESGLEALVGVIQKLGIQSVAIPPLGAGLGGLEWPEVKQRIESALSPMEGLDVRVYEPAGAPQTEKMVRNREVPNITPGRAALVELMDRYLAGLLDPFVTLLEVHKLMYFMQEAGEPLRLDYHKGAYGPYARNLSHVLKKIEGHMVSGYADGGDAPAKQLSLVPGAVKEAQKLLEKEETTKAHFARVSQLVEGFESPYGMELLATVHWVAKKEAADTVDRIVEKTHAWNDRKQRFTPRQIELAGKTLAKHGWIELRG